MEKITLRSEIQSHLYHTDRLLCRFEGGGDAVFSDPNTLWAGYGARSSKTVCSNQITIDMNCLGI